MAVITIPNNIVVINRGDTYTFNFDLTDENGNLYRLKGEDTLYFGLMQPNQMFENALVKKRFTVEDYADGVAGDSTLVTIVIEPEDTLTLFPAKYYYAIKLHLRHEELDGSGNTVEIDKVVTFINKTKFIICD